MSLSFYFSRLKIPPLTSWLYIECSDHPHCHLQDSLSMTVPFLLWAAKMLDRALQKWSYKSWITLLDLLVVFLPRHPRVLLAFFTARAHWWCLFIYCPSWSLGHFYSEFLPSCSYPQYWCVVSSSLRCKVCICILDHYCSLSSSFRIPILPSSALAAPLTHLQICESCSSYHPKSHLKQPHSLSRVLPSQRAEGIGLNMMGTA